MKKIMILLTVLLIGFPVIIIAGEKEVLKSLETLKASGGVSDKKYDELLRDAIVEFNILKRSPGVNKEFLDTAQECLKKYGQVSYFRMAALEGGIATERARRPAAEIEAAMRPHYDARQKSMEDATILLDKLYTYLK